MWWRRLAEVQTKHQNGEERGFKWLWTWNGCWCIYIWEWLNKVRVFILEWTIPLNVLHDLYQHAQTLANRRRRRIEQMCPWRRTDKTQQNRRWDAAGRATPEPCHILQAYFISLFSASPVAGWERRVTCQQIRSKAKRATFSPMKKAAIQIFPPCEAGEILLQ